jgi:hypothetical protein
MEKKIMTKETAKALGAKLKFKNKLYEAVDDPTISLINNLILDKIAEKLPDEVLLVVQETIAMVIDEMPEIEI